MDPIPKKRLVLTTRWWKTAARTFALLEFIALWFAFFLLLLGSREPGTKQKAIAIVLVPLPAAALIATALESKRDPEALTSSAAQGNLAAVLGWFTFPLVLGPVSLLGFIMLTRFTYELSMAQTRGEARPFLAESEGFCAPPRYFVRQGLPVAALTVRLPHAGRYRFQAEGRSSRGRFCGGRLDTSLRKGVFRIEVPMSRRGEVHLQPDDLAWPVTVQRILVKSLEERNGSPAWFDARQGDSLATVALGDSIPPEASP